MWEDSELGWLWPLNSHIVPGPGCPRERSERAAWPAPITRRGLGSWTHGGLHGVLGGNVSALFRDLQACCPWSREPDPRRAWGRQGRERISSLFHSERDGMRPCSHPHAHTRSRGMHAHTQMGTDLTSAQKRPPEAHTCMRTRHLGGHRASEAFQSAGLEDSLRLPHRPDLSRGQGAEFVKDLRRASTL